MNACKCEAWVTLNIRHLSILTKNGSSHTIIRKRGYLCAETDLLWLRQHPHRLDISMQCQIETLVSIQKHVLYPQDLSLWDPPIESELEKNSDLSVQYGSHDLCA